MGYGGQISLDAGGFGFGAYTSGVLSVKFGFSPWAGLPAAAALTALSTVVVNSARAATARSLSFDGDDGLERNLGCPVQPVRRHHRRTNGLLGVKPFSFFGIRLDTDAKQFPLVWIIVARNDAAHSQPARFALRAGAARNRHQRTGRKCARHRQFWRQTAHLP